MSTSPDPHSASSYQRIRHQKYNIQPLYVTVVVLRKKAYKTTTSSGTTPTWDASCELLVVSLRRLSISVNTCASASRMVEPSSVLSFSLKRFRGRLAPVLLVGSVNIRTIDLLHQCSGEQRKSILS